jgi:Flp pilus assembly protein TadD
VAKKSLKPVAQRRQTLPPRIDQSRRVSWAIALTLAVLTIATYAPVWRFSFVALDDPQYVYANKDIAAGVTPQSIAWAFTTGHEANWHPVTWLSHALDVSLFGLNSGLHHGENVLLHLVTTLLLFAVLMRMTRAAGPSMFVAAIFAVHPLHVESVAWVAERKDVLSALFFVVTLGAYVRYVERPSAGRYVMVAVALAVGLMSKAMLVTMPMVLLLLDYWPLARRKAFAALAIEKLPLLLLVAASSVVTFLVQKQGGAVKSLESFPVALRLQNAIVSYMAYLKATIWPVDLGVFYPFPSSIPIATVVVSATGLLVISAGALWLVRRAPAVTVGWFWCLGMLVPVIGLVQIGGQARADRYMYLPLIGLSIAAAWGSMALARTTAHRRIAAAAGVVVVAASAGVAHAQVQYWRDTVTLWSHTASATEGSENFGVYFGLAEYLRANGRAAESIPVYEASIARNGRYLDSRLGLVRALVDTGQKDRAISMLREVVAMNPDVAESRMSLGLLLSEAGRLAEAIPQFGAAVQLRPTDAGMRNDYARALAQNRQFAESAAQFQDVVRLDPSRIDARLGWAIALMQLNRLDEAATQLREVLRRDPANDTAKRALAAIGR